MPYICLPTENISQYTARTILPEIDAQGLPAGPIEGYKSHQNDLSTRFLKPHRTLETISLIDLQVYLVPLVKCTCSSTFLCNVFSDDISFTLGKEIYFPTTRILTNLNDEYYHRLQYRAPAVYDFISLPTIWSPEYRLQYRIHRPVDVVQPTDFQEYVFCTTSSLLLIFI